MKNSHNCGYHAMIAVNIVEILPKERWGSSWGHSSHWGCIQNSPRSLSIHGLIALVHRHHSCASSKTHELNLQSLAHHDQNLLHGRLTSLALGSCICQAKHQLKIKENESGVFCVEPNMFFFLCFCKTELFLFVWEMKATCTFTQGGKWRGMRRATHCQMNSIAACSVATQWQLMDWKGHIVWSPTTNQLTFVVACKVPHNQTVRLVIVQSNELGGYSLQKVGPSSDIQTI